jgi:Protein of unknown function (DUF3703)
LDRELTLNKQDMKFYWAMPLNLKVHYLTELEEYRKELADGNLTPAWRHLERAHIIGQAWPREHNYVHFLMLRFGMKIKSRQEILGQIPRLILGGVKSFVGHIPVGNTGGANVPGLKPMEIPQDLQLILKPYRSTF